MGKGLFLVKNKPKPKNGVSVLDFYVFFIALENLSSRKFEKDFGCMEIASFDNENGTTYFIFIVGGINNQTHIISSNNKKIAIGFFSPGVYIISGDLGNVLMPEHKVYFRNFLEYTRSNMDDLYLKMSQFLVRHDEQAPK